MQLSGQDRPADAGSFAVCCALLFAMLAVAAFGLVRIIPPASGELTALARQTFLHPRFLIPEPQERGTYIALVLSLPLLIAIAITLGGRIRIRPVLEYLIWGALAALGIAAIWMSPDAVTRMTPASYGPYVIAGVVFVACLFAPRDVWRTHDFRYAIAGLLFLFSLFVTFGWKVYSIDFVQYDWTFFGHLDAYLYPIVQTLNGQTCLVDYASQYGCYSEFIAPVLRLTGASILAITRIMAVLQSIAIGAILWFCCRTIKSPAAVAVAGLLLVIVTDRLFHVRPDPYFQYHPNRLLFPALSLLFVLDWKPTVARTIGAGIFSAVAILWNLDSGLVVVVALVAFAAFQSIENLPRAVVDASLVGLGCVAGLLAIFGLLSVKGGALIDPENIWHFQKTFFGMGYAMLPVTRAGWIWLIVAAIPCVTLLVYGRNFKARSNDLSSAAFLATTSLGIFGYFIGRSHIETLVISSWPMVVLAAFLLDTGLHWQKTASKCLIAGLIAVALTIILVRLPDFQAAVASKNNAQDPAHIKVREDVQFVRETSRNEPVAILTANQAVILLEAERAPALPGGGIVEILLKDEAAAVLDHLISKGPPSLYLSKSILQMGSDRHLRAYAAWVKDGLSRIESVYDLKQQNDRLLHYVRR